VSVKEGILQINMTLTPGGFSLFGENNIIGIGKNICRASLNIVWSNKENDNMVARRSSFWARHSKKEQKNKLVIWWIV
jgi:TPP-dependent trihydroxycyclohexane-1,2-dione (THcHDO) dehydratase